MSRSRRNALLAAVLTLGVLAFGSAQAATYYVRTDGGDATQCTGRSDAAYPGKGTGQACAWKHPFFALPPGGTPRIAGGDTLYIGDGSYQMGQGAPGSGSCGGASCYMAAIPTGPSATSRTRILGKAGSTPVLWGSGNTKRILNLEARSNVEIGNLEITDHDDCVYGHSQATVACKTGGPWARVGLYATGAANIWLHDLDIHGLAHMGLNTGAMRDWTVERVKINRNGLSGWDGSVGAEASSNSGRIVLRNVEIGWNGCGERWQTGEVWACWGQQTGGYGDGIGMYYTGGQWLIEDSYIHHNTQDGLDLRYMDGADDTTVTVRRLYAVANAGNQAKIRGNAVIENSVLVSNCAWWRGRYYMVEDDNCRAAGNTLQLVPTSGDTILVRHNTITGQGGVLIGANEGDSTSTIGIQNNVLMGFPRWDDATTQSSTYYANNAPAKVTWAGNLVWKVNNNSLACPSGSICGQDPKLKDMSLAGFDATPLAGSPVIDRVAQLADVASDFLLQPRPSGARSDIGAYEVQVAATTPVPTPTPSPSPAPAPSCTRTAPSMSLAGPDSAVAAGMGERFTLTLTNNDSSACGATTFSLARTVPAGWTGSLDNATLTLAPGSSSTATLQVDAAADAAAGDYAVAVGAGSSLGGPHTASVAAFFSVKLVQAFKVSGSATAAGTTPGVGLSRGGAMALRPGAEARRAARSDVDLRRARPTLLRALPPTSARVRASAR